MTSPTPPPPKPAPYPAPYEDPWRRLGVDLRAVVASSGLKLRELQRRNREGDLSVPGFWPVNLASFFWPLLLALALAAAVALAIGLTRQQAPAPAPGPAQSPAVPLAPTPAPAKPSTALQAAVPAPELTPISIAPAPAFELDPLLALLAADDPSGWIASARPHPAEGRLDLELADPFQSLAPQRRQEQANLWLQRSQELGYGGLRLLDGNGVALGQAARVGSGMVLLDPPERPQS